MIPLRVLNRLQLGRVISAEVKAIQPDHRAWVHVISIVDPQRGYLEYPSNNREGILVSQNPLDEPIVGFKIRYREIHRKFEENPYNWDIIGLAVDQEIEVTNLEQLEAVLTNWLTDLSKLDLPHLDGAPF